MTIRRISFWIGWAVGFFVILAAGACRGPGAEVAVDTSPSDDVETRRDIDVAADVSDTSASLADAGDVTDDASMEAETGDAEPMGYPDPFEIDRSNPWIYINDIPTDNFNGELAVAMGSDDREGVNLQGFVMEFPRPAWWGDDQKFREARDEYKSHHQKTHQKAVASGFTDLPPPEFGPFRRHEKPPSGKVEDTQPIGSAGTRRIVAAAKEASPEDPLVVSAGGPLVTIADAFLRDPSIAHKIVVYWRGRPATEDPGWNEKLSGWSETIVARNLTLVLTLGNGGPGIRRERVEREFPDEPLKTYMLTKVYDGTEKNPFGDDGFKGDADSVASLSPFYPEQRGEVEYLEIDGFVDHWKVEEEIPKLVPTSKQTRIRLIPEHDNLTEAWWSHMGDPTTWDGK